MNQKLHQTFFFVLIAVAGGAWFAFAADEEWKLPPETARLKPGPGADLVTGNCFNCHSVDYLSTQPPLTRDQWKASIIKMQQKYGAPVATNNVDALLDYLVKNYGRAK
ncbi:MAG: cytochrome c [Verrucomicrobia bacterium]|nr:cytochrome c [Verrucomicrobiota bacterium]